MEIKLILTELCFFFKLKGLEFVKSTPSTVFKGSFFKACIHCVDIMKMCMWSFDGYKFKFDKVTGF